MQTRTIVINGKKLVVRAGMTAAEIKSLVGIAPGRVIIARRDDGTLALSSDQRPLSGAYAIDAPRFIFG